MIISAGFSARPNLLWKSLIVTGGHLLPPMVSSAQFWGLPTNDHLASVFSLDLGCSEALRKAVGACAV